MPLERRVGVDIGSTTLKAVVLDEGDNVLYAQYRRHRSDVRGELALLLEEMAAGLPGLSAPLRVTGSAGMGVSQELGLPFVQEVVAATAAVDRFLPETDVFIELGGEDAKITYLKPTLSQRMNGTCAGGTGAFIDQMAALLQTDARGLNELAKEHKTLYTIASRCGVFAKSDMQPLLNEGVSREDLAASVFQAVVNQTIAGLACGQPIAGTVAFLGGPLHYLSELRAAFERTLAARGTSFVTPERAEVFVAVGAALGAQGEPVPLDELAVRLRTAPGGRADMPRLARLFDTPEDRAAFDTRHAGDTAPRAPMEEANGPCFLGLDAGSTTVKAALTADDGKLLYSYYTPNKGSPLQSALDILKNMYAALPPTAYIAGACV
ncbi:MAG: hypothetical protein LBT60_05410, partial [Oscillospiraceae bacterium]|nr:hypothetical protein [Oscillospiraceae bacterium]